MPFTTSVTDTGGGTGTGSGTGTGTGKRLKESSSVVGTGERSCRSIPLLRKDFLLSAYGRWYWCGLQLLCRDSASLTEFGISGIFSPALKTPQTLRL